MSAGFVEAGRGLTGEPADGERRAVGGSLHGGGRSKPWSMCSYVVAVEAQLHPFRRPQARRFALEAASSSQLRSWRPGLVPLFSGRASECRGEDPRHNARPGEESRDQEDVLRKSSRTPVCSIHLPFRRLQLTSPLLTRSCRNQTSLQCVLPFGQRRRTT